MSPKDFCEKAVAGGWSWDTPRVRLYVEKTRTWPDVPAEIVMLDPLAWKSVFPGKDCDEGCSTHGWRAKMHHMIDAIADGKTIEQFLETL